MSITFNMNVAAVAQPEDPCIKLFGRRIPFPDSQLPSHHEPKTFLGGAMKVGLDVSFSGEKSQPTSKLKLTASDTEKEEIGNGSVDQEKAVKKPDKIIPCPRCNSLETKFCYFNNYNVNQPRHFCKNCQRYWTAGGTMRNVPIGAGRRKNKHLPSQYRQILVSPDGVAVNKLESTDSIAQQLVQLPDCSNSSCSSSSRMVLQFGHEGSQSKSMETGVTVSDKSGYVEALDEPSASASSANHFCRVGRSSEDSTEKENDSVRPLIDLQTVPHLLLPWNPVWNSSKRSPENVTPPPPPPPICPVQATCAQSISVQFIPNSVWSCAPVWAPGEGSSSGNGCFVLGKHSRDSILADNHHQSVTFSGKTQRIDGSNKGSFWSALGHQPDNQRVFSAKTHFTFDESKGNLHGCEAKAVGIGNCHVLRREW